MAFFCQRPFLSGLSHWRTRQRPDRIPTCHQRFALCSCTDEHSPPCRFGGERLCHCITRLGCVALVLLQGLLRLSSPPLGFLALVLISRFLARPLRLGTFLRRSVAPRKFMPRLHLRHSSREDSTEVVEFAICVVPKRHDFFRRCDRTPCRAIDTTEREADPIDGWSQCDPRGRFGDCRPRLASADARER